MNPGHRTWQQVPLFSEHLTRPPLPPEFSAEWLTPFGRHGFCALHEVQRQSCLIHKFRSSPHHIIPNTGCLIGGNVFFSNRGTWPVWNRQAFCYESLWIFCLYMAIIKQDKILIESRFLEKQTYLWCVNLSLPVLGWTSWAFLVLLVKSLLCLRSQMPSIGFCIWTFGHNLRGDANFRRWNLDEEIDLQRETLRFRAGSSFLSSLLLNPKQLIWTLSGAWVFYH